MNENTKEKKRYILINIILLLIILTLMAYIYLMIKQNKETIITGYEYSTNIIVSTLKLEKSNAEKEAQNKENMYIDKNITNYEEYDFSKSNNNKYYYNQLNRDSKLIYDTIEANLNNMKSGTYKIKLPNNVAETLKANDGEKILDKNFQSAWDALSLDRVDMFFIDVSKINLNIQKRTYGDNVAYSLEINPIDSGGYLENGLTDEISVNTVLNQVKNARENIISSINGDTYSKILQAHDWIIDNLQYSPETQKESAYNLYGALIEKSAVCEGYAEAFKYILDELEIPCILVSGSATNTRGITENHEWNYVKIDEKWYAIDTTWDDPIVSGGGYITNTTKHKYFVQGSKIMNENHIPKGKFTESGQEFKYPELEKNSYKK